MKKFSDFLKLSYFFLRNKINILRNFLIGFNWFNYYIRKKAFFKMPYLCETDSFVFSVKLIKLYFVIYCDLLLRTYKITVTFYIIFHFT